ncbi:unnamed protein product [Leptosia nina]|uniref:Uncharacterized protein n=1 Tax=Leptosia nina TaxID=320188 RepID=A0AAV1JNE6_9NEOP
MEYYSVFIRITKFGGFKGTWFHRRPLSWLRKRSDGSSRKVRSGIACCAAAAAANEGQLFSPYRESYKSRDRKVFEVPTLRPQEHLWGLFNSEDTRRAGKSADPQSDKEQGVAGSDSEDETVYDAAIDRAHDSESEV